MYPVVSTLRRRRRADRVTFDNVVANPEDFSQWGTGGTPTVTGGQLDPFGGTNAFLLIDDDGATNERVFDDVVFATDGDKGLSIYVREGSSPPAAGTQLILRDTTASENHVVTVTWSAGTPSVAGTADGIALGVLEGSGGWYRLLLRALTITAANSHIFQINIAGTAPNTGNIYVFGAAAYDEPTPGAYAR